MRDSNGKFIGFDSPHYTQVPDEIFDELLSELSGSELKVLLYVVRRTFGFKKDSDQIALSQMVNGITKKDGTVLDRGTGLDKKTVVRAVKSLVKRDILNHTRKSCPKQGHLSSEYALNLRTSPLWNNATRGLDAKTTHRLVEKCHTQDTAKQDTDITLYENSREPLKPVDNSDRLKEKALLGQIMLVCKDLDSLPYYRNVVRTFPHQAIFSALSQVKEAQALGRIKKTPGAMFVDLVKRQTVEYT